MIDGNDPTYTRCPAVLQFYWIKFLRFFNSEKKHLHSVVFQEEKHQYKLDEDYFADDVVACP